MDRRPLTVAVAVLASLGCVTSTAHRLPIVNNPLRAEAEDCEARCHALLRPVSACGPGTDLEAPCDPAARYVDRDPYAKCLDSCPGATAIDGASCSDHPSPDDVCEQTHKANAGGIAGGVVAVAAIVGSILLVSAFVQAFDNGINQLERPNFPP
jgi:hypothetical protein